MAKYLTKNPLVGMAGLSVVASLFAAVAGYGSASAQSQFDPYPDIAGPAQVVEGDRLIVNGTPVRLYGIDAPEMGQICFARGNRPYDCGMAGRNMLEMIIDGRDVECAIYSDLHTGTRSGSCWVGGISTGLDVGAAMVYRGFAFSERGHSNRYERHEASAQARRAGVWSGRAQRPWAWRQEQAERGLR